MDLIVLAVFVFTNSDFFETPYRAACFCEFVKMNRNEAHLVKSRSSKVQLYLYDFVTKWVTRFAHGEVYIY
jgi:hypothetical protein